MRVAQVSTLGTAVGPTGSGSVEGHVWLLSEELIALGHEVTVFASADSVTSAELVSTVTKPYGRGGELSDWHLSEWLNLCRAVEQSGRFDVLHAHAYLWSLPLDPLSRAPMVHTTHVMPTTSEAALRSTYPAAVVSAISRYQWSAFPDLEPAVVVYHAVDQSRFTFRAQPEDYVCFLGRFLPEKGCAEAIQLARHAGIRLVLAGPSNAYYRQVIAPEVDGTSVEYVGPVTALARSELLGGARALLYPLIGPEPFGLVMAEAMMCGTPVLASGIGAVPEVVDEGVTGCCVTSPALLASRLSECLGLDRRRVRARAEKRFSARRMATEYATFYERVLGERT